MSLSYKEMEELYKACPFPPIWDNQMKNIDTDLKEMKNDMKEIKKLLKEMDQKDTEREIKIAKIETQLKTQWWLIAIIFLGTGLFALIKYVFLR